jgi:hypothetical protein
MNPFPVVRVAHIKIVEDQDPWLIRGLWGREAVGFVGGTPKSLKTWMALEMCVAVASGSPCLGRFAVTQPGHVLLYAAEDAAEDIRHRVEGIARARRLDFERLAVGLITEPILRLDLPEHQLRLADTVAKIKPRLLVLDPLVRLHRGDENSASDVSGLLGFLRLLQREHHLAIVLVHHIRKANASQPGQALRGSGGQEGQTALEVSTREPACTGSLPVRRAGRQGPCRGERERPRDGSWERQPARGAARPSTTSAAPFEVDDGPWCCCSLQAPTASGSRARSDCSHGGARAAACSSPLTTRIVAGGMTTVRRRMGAPQRGQETLSSWKILHINAAQASHAGWGPSAGSLVSRMRRCSGVVSTGGAPSSPEAPRRSWPAAPRARPWRRCRR